jgi:SSS family solute:Na+ symporter
MAIAWGAIGGRFIAPYVYGLFWKGATKAGAIAGLLSGLGIALLLYIAWGEPGVPIAGAVAMLAPLVVMPVVSLATGGGRKTSQT